MFNQSQSFYLQPCLFTMEFIPWNSTCILCRLLAIVLSLIASLCFLFNMRFIFMRGCRNHLVFSLILASMFVLIISIPGMLIQLFTCHRHCIPTYCRIEGFTSYLSGCVCMLILMMLAIHRYLKFDSHFHFCQTEYSNYFCWFFGLIFTFPLVFDYFNTYLPEGLGFHCSIDWQDQSTISRCYIAASFLLLYFIPFISLVYFSCRVNIILQHVRTDTNILYSHHSDSNPTSSSDVAAAGRRPVSPSEEKSQTTMFIRHAKDRQRYRINFQYLRAIIILIGNYIIAWTPYSIIAVLQLLKIDLIYRYGYVMTFSALLGKFSVIITPLLYVRLMNKPLYRRLLF